MVCKLNPFRKLIGVPALTFAIILISNCSALLAQSPANSTLRQTAQNVALTNKNSEQEAKLVGTWMIVTATLNKSNGEKENFYGENPKGSLTFDQNGRYMLTVIRDELKHFWFESRNRERGTAEENSRVVRWSIANFGTYSIENPTGSEDKDKSVLVLRIESATYPNWFGITQRRSISFNPAGNELTYIVPEASSGPGTTAVFVWRRT